MLKKIAQIEEVKGTKVTPKFKSIRQKFCIKKTTMLTIIVSNFVREQLINFPLKNQTIDPFEPQEVQDLKILASSSYEKDNLHPLYNYLHQKKNRNMSSCILHAVSDSFEAKKG